MSALELIANALAAGAGAGVTGVTTKAVEDLYAQLKALLGREPAVAGAIAELEGERAAPSVWESRLAGTGLDPGPDALAVAQRLVEAARPKYQVNMPGAQGVQIGDGNTQHNAFG